MPVAEMSECTSTVCADKGDIASSIPNNPINIFQFIDLQYLYYYLLAELIRVDNMFEKLRISLIFILLFTKRIFYFSQKIWNVQMLRTFFKAFATTYARRSWVAPLYRRH